MVPFAKRSFHFRITFGLPSIKIQEDFLFEFKFGYFVLATYVLAEQVWAILEALDVFWFVLHFCGSHHATTVVCEITTYYQLQLPRYYA